MYQFKVESQAFANAMRKIALAIPTTGKGENDNIQVAMYKEVVKDKGGLVVFVAFDGKIQAISTMPIHEVIADKEAENVYISGKQALAAANAFAAMDGILQMTVENEFSISGMGSQVALKLGQKVACLKSADKIYYEIEMPTEEFVQYATFASSCYGLDKGMKQMHCVGIRLDILNNKMVSVSSNSYRCAYAETKNFKLLPVGGKQSQDKLDGEENISKKDSITVVIEGKQLKNAVQNLTAKKKVVIGFEEKRIRIKCGSDVIIILTQDVLFPMDALLEVVKNGKRTGAWKAQLAKVFQALSVYEITMETPWLEISKKNEAEIVFRGKDESTCASIGCAQEGEIQKLVVDEKQFKSALSVFAKEQDIIIETISEERPLCIRQNLEDPSCIIVMPISPDAE